MSLFRNRNLKIIIVIIALSALVLPFSGSNIAHAQASPVSWINRLMSLPTVGMGLIGEVLLRLGALVLAIAGMGLDLVLDYTIVHMSERLGAGAGNLGDAISGAWGTLRDIANLAFIFVLLYAAVSVILSLQVKSIGSTIKNIVIIGLLINFSMFLTKVVIDAANIATVGFYNIIIAGAGADFPIVGSNLTVTPGFATIFMRAVGVQSFFSGNILSLFQSGTQNTIMFLTGVLGAITMLILAVVFLVVAVMFLARFILLVFLIIVSPLAFVAYILPALKGHFDTWKNSLLQQAFFAPLFMLMIWVTVRIVAAPGFLAFNGSFDTIARDGAIGLLFKFALIIGFIIASLVFAKNMASKSFGFNAVSGALGVNRVAGVVGGVTLGGAAAVGRRTVGAAASRLAQSQALSNWAGRSWVGQKVKEGTEGVAKSSFDVRQTKSIGGALQGTALGSFGTGKAGGYDATLAAQIAAKEKTAAGLKTDAARQAYAARQVSGPLSRFYARGGSAPGHAPSLFGTMGRGNRIVASRILNNQITTLRTDLNNGNTELTRYQNVINSGGALSPTQLARFTTLNGPIGTNGSLADMQDQITNIQAQINTLGIINPANTTRGGRPLRADEQNY